MLTSVVLHWVHCEVHRSMDRSRKFFRFHQLQPFLRHCTTMPFDCSEKNCCNQNLDFEADAFAAVVNGVVDVVDIDFCRHQRQCNDYYTNLHC